MTAYQQPLVQLRGVSKRFGGTQALTSVDVDFLAGEVHALVGENGAGKSTLGKIVAGLYSLDEGELLVEGQRVGRWDPIRAQRAGVVMIAQELSLVPQLTVEQNVFLGIEASTFGVLSPGSSRRFQVLQDSVGFELNPKARVSTLRIAEQQKVEIMRSLARDAKVIVMDEPTSSLTSHETAQLHELIKKLREQGRSVIYVSHFLDSVLEVSDQITILRDGVKIRTSERAAETKDSMVHGMLGRELAVTFPPRVAAVSQTIEPLLSIRNVSTSTGVSDVSLDVRPGEIVGLLGLVGSGRSEIARAIAGSDSISSGSVKFRGKTHTRWTIKDAIFAGLVMVPEDRHAQGLVLQRNIRENVSLSFLSKFAHVGVINRKKEEKQVTSLVGNLEMRPLDIDLSVGSFSGGNQQKALLAKWLIGDPSFIILDEPTRGVDIGAKAVIYKLIADIASRGISVLLISSEHEEVLALATRAYIVADGTIAGEIDPTTITVEELLERLFSSETNIGVTA